MLRNLKIQTRLLLSYAIIILLLFTASVTALFMLRGVGLNLTDFYNENFQTVVESWTSRRAVYAAKANMLQSMLETDPTESQKCIDTTKEELAALQAVLPVLRVNFSGDVALIDQADRLLAQAMEYQDDIFELAADNQNQEAFDMMTDKYTPAIEQFQKMIKQISEEAANDAEAMVGKSERSTISAIVIVLCISIASVVFGLWIGILISRGIKKPIAEIENAAKEMAKGNLHTSIFYQSKDELGDLADSMRSTIHTLELYIHDLSRGLLALEQGDLCAESALEYEGDFVPLKESLLSVFMTLNGTIGQISQSSNQVSSGADQVASGAQALSQGATEQASAVEELAAIINEISEQVKRNADSAKRARDKAEAVGGEMTESERQMKHMIAAMQEISLSSSEIGKIIKTIEDIAFQTNILALNAAIEAARAGTAGKGFAVVADEVRNLASKSAEASKNTAVLIEGSIRAVENGTKIADATASALLGAVDGAKEVTETVSRISEASEEQARSIIQVTRGVDQISAVVQTNSATAEESAAASEALSSQSQILRELVAKFQIKDIANPFEMKETDMVPLEPLALSVANKY